MSKKNVLDPPSSKWPQSKAILKYSSYLQSYPPILKLSTKSSIYNLNLTYFICSWILHFERPHIFKRRLQNLQIYLLVHIIETFCSEILLLLEPIISEVKFSTPEIGFSLSVEISSFFSPVFIFSLLDFPRTDILKSKDEAYMGEHLIWCDGITDFINEKER